MTYRATILADSPVAYWPLDDWSRGTPTQALDAGPNAIHSTAFGGSYPGFSAKPGPISGVSCGWFDGSSQGVTIPGTGLLDLQTFTIEAWVRPQAVLDGAKLSQSGFIFEKTTNGSVNTQYSMFFEGTDVVFRTVVAGTLSDVRWAFNPNMDGRHWYHMCAVRTGSTGGKSIYWNSLLAASNAPTVQTLDTNPAGTSFIGVYGTGGYRYLGGIAHVAVYGSALTTTQMANHMAAAGQDSVSY